MIKKSSDTEGSKPNELPATDQWTDDQLAAYGQIEADMNAKILEVTMTIRREFPELSKFIEEMPVTVPDKKNPSVTLNNLKGYYESLSGMLHIYREEHGSK